MWGFISRAQFETLSLRCLLDIQVEMLSRQLDICAEGGQAGDINLGVINV